MRLYQEKISVQETLEHNTGCGADMLELPTPEGPVCVNVIQDNLLHGGVAWNSIPESKNDALLVMGVSSRHQDAPEEFEQGRYRVEGEVVSTSRVNESLPEGSMLIIYDMERIGDIDYEAVTEDARGILETRTGELTTQLREQIAREGVEIGSGDDKSDGGWRGPYVDERGVVDNAGLNAAISDYLSGDLSDSKLNAIIGAYLSGESIV